MKEIRIGFFKATGCGRACQRYSHVELRFSDGTVTSVTSPGGPFGDPGTVHYDQQRILSNNQYSCFIACHVTDQQELAMHELAYQYFEEKRPFAWFAMYWNFLCCCCPSKRRRAVFCSEYVVLLLQAGGLLLDVNAWSTSPTSLYWRLMEEPEQFHFSVNNKKVRKIVVYGWSKVTEK